MMGEKMNRSRIAFGLLCGLAVCCSVMYITSEADVADESVLATGFGFARSTRVVRAARPKVHGIGGPSSVHSTDVQKAGQIFTNTPKGRMRLDDYLRSVEREIAAEAASEKRDVANVRAQMDRNFAFNVAARKKLKAALLRRMAYNARKARHDLHRAMRYTQWRFAKAAHLANIRNRANIRASAAIRRKVAVYRAEAARNLRHQVVAQQRSQAAYASAINARIKRTDKSVAINAAQIKSNAKAAQKALESAVAKFDKKANNAKALAAKGRSKLAAQLRRQAKATRQWANNRLKVVIAKTAARFRRVRARMARDRKHADFALKTATTHMTASLNAAKALNDKRFAKNVKRIAKARREAAARVAASKRLFRTKIRSLRATVQQQVAKTNARISQLSGVVDKNKLAQAKVNANVRAEMDRMIKVGNKRYRQHLKKDAELKRLINSNKAANDRRLKAMANHYASELDKVRSTMKKNRAHATRMLAKKTAALYSAIAKSEKQQMAVNGRLSKLTRDARLDTADALRGAKREFAKRMANLHSNIIRNDKKFEKKLDGLTGIVRKNAVKSAKGRADLADIMKANNKLLKAEVSGAVHKGEMRMMKAEARIKAMNKKTKASLNMKITARISAYAKRAAAQIQGLRMESKAARAALKKELLYAVSSASKEAKKNLGAAFRKTKKMFDAANRKEAAAARKNAAGRAKLARKVVAQQRAARRQLNDAVGTMSRSLNALKIENRKKISKANRSITAYADQLAKQQKNVQASMKGMMSSLTGKIRSTSRKNMAAIRAANGKSARGFRSVNLKIRRAISKANEKTNKRFSKLFLAMSKQRRKQNQALNRGVININQAIAKQAALSDSRFSKTVKDIKKARAEATRQVRAARKSFATRLTTTTSAIKSQENRLLGEVKLVSEELTNHKVAQSRINRRTAAEMKRITKLANTRNSQSVRARGKLRALLDANKKAAAEEVKALNGLFTRKLSNIRKAADRNARQAGRDLKKETAKLYGKLAKVQLQAALANAKSARKINRYAKVSQSAIRAAKASYSARLTTMTNLMAANRRKAERGLEVLTGVIRNYKANGKKDRALIRAQNKALARDMQSKISAYTQEGEARAKRIAHRARRNLKAAKKSMLLEISARVEATANKVFKSIQGNHKKIADNYLSLKAYAVTARGKLSAYVKSGKGRNLSSLGELLVDVAALSNVKVKPSAGIGGGLSKIPSVFSSSTVKVSSAMTKINGLVNEYSQTVNKVRTRWSMGLGKYLLMKLEESMQKKGVLQVDKLSKKKGNYVYVNGRTVGLSNKLNDFEGLAVRMAAYEKTLAILTAKLAGKYKKTNKAHVAYVKPPAWRGD
jgi:hypothetical protein